MIDANEMLALIAETEAKLFSRLRTTADDAEKQTLKRTLKDLNKMRGEVARAGLAELALKLNDLSDRLEAVTRGVRLNPVDGFLSELDQMFDRVSGLLGRANDVLSGGIAVDQIN